MIKIARPAVLSSSEIPSLNTATESKVESNLKISLHEKLENEISSEKNSGPEPILTQPIVKKSSVDSSSIDRNCAVPSASTGQLLEEEKKFEVPSCEVKLSEGHSDNNEKTGLVIRKRRKKDHEVIFFSKQFKLNISNICFYFSLLAD